MGRRGFIFGLLAMAALILPTGALAATDTYVDDGAATDTAPCAQGLPCQHIAFALLQTDAGGTVHVAPGTYMEQLQVTGGKSLVYDGTGAAFGALIDGTTTAAISVLAGQSAGTIQGLTLRGQNTALSLSGPGTVTGNKFDSTQANSFGLATAGSDPKTISGNQFTGNGAVKRTGMDLDGTATVTGNTFDHITNAISSLEGSPTISGNTIDGTGTGNPSLAIEVRSGVTIGANPVITGNYIHDFNLGGGIAFTQLVGTATVGGNLSQNRVINTTTGLSADDTAGMVTTRSDLFAANGVGINGRDQVGGATDRGNLTVDNDTVVGSSFDIRIFDVALTLDSSIVGAAGIDKTGGGLSTTQTCTITNSRGPTITTPADGCGAFATTADPGFVHVDPIGDPNLNDYHLAPGSPLIDLGTAGPAAPGEADFDGNPRAVAGTCGGTARRDMGAYEFIPDCPAPAQPGSSNPAAVPSAAATKKKCKKKKRHHAVAAKKCKKKKR